MWFQHKGTPAHFANAVSAYLSRKFGGKWVGRSGPVSCSPRSTYLSPLDSFVWGAMKNMVYETLVDSIMDIVARMSVAVSTISEMPGIF